MRIWLSLPAVWIVMTVAAVGAATQGYDQARHWISDLAADGAHHQSLAQSLIFGGFGASLLVASWLGGRAWPHGRGRAYAQGLLGSAAIGVWGAGVFACDEGCPMLSSSPKQIAHNLSAVWCFGSLLGAAAIWAWPARRWASADALARRSAVTIVVGLGLGLLVAAAGLYEAELKGAAQKAFVVWLCGWLATSGTSATSPAES